MTTKEKAKEINDQVPPGAVDPAGESGNAPGSHPEKDLSADFPDQYPGIGLDRGDIFLDDFGREIPDPTPMAPPVGYKRQPTMVEIIRQQIQGEALRRAAAEMGKESWQEADDFDVGDDYDPTSPWEEQFDPVGYAPGALQRHEAAFLAAQAANPSPEPKGPLGPSGAADAATDSSPKAAVVSPPAATPQPKP